NTMKKSIKIICAIVVLLAVAAGGFFAGRASVKEVYTQTFYASVEQIGDGWILVEGLEVNDINHRGAFYRTRRKTPRFSHGDIRRRSSYQIVASLTSTWYNTFVRIWR
ncbi:MAG: hypothetical protein J6R54_04535, partial [Bacteroidaceae bacterium]|nr:hypothetical protein [Bacteroidaceae bacterium]